MKKVYSHVLIELDPDDKKQVQRIVDKISLISEDWFGISRLFIKADFKADAPLGEGWTYEDVKHPTMAKTRLLEILRNSRARIKATDELLADLQEKVKNTK